MLPECEAVCVVHLIGRGRRPPLHLLPLAAKTGSTALPRTAVGVKRPSAISRGGRGPRFPVPELAARLQARRRRGGPPLLLPGLAAGEGGAAPAARPPGRLHAQFLLNRGKLPGRPVQPIRYMLHHSHTGRRQSLSGGGYDSPVTAAHPGGLGTHRSSESETLEKAPHRPAQGTGPRIL